jgi:hypothetical protein
LESYVQAAKGFEQGLLTSAIAEKTGWSADYIETIKPWWKEALQNNRAAQSIVKARQDVPIAAVIEQKTYEEPPHKKQIRKKALEIAIQIPFIQAAYNFFSEDPTARSTWVRINNSLAGALCAALFSHLQTEGFSDTLDELIFWEENASKIRPEVHKLRKRVKDDMEDEYHLDKFLPNHEFGNYVPDEQKRSESVDFIMDCAIKGIKKEWKMQWIFYLMADIAVPLNPKNDHSLDQFTSFTNELIAKYVEDERAKEIRTQLTKLQELEKHIKSQLEEFAFTYPVPGECELCSEKQR